MRMNQDEIRFDFHGLGLAIKQAREERGWTQAYVAELVGKTDRTIMNIENKGQNFKITDNIVYTEAAAYPFQKENTELAQAVNNTLQTMRQSGELKQLSEQWFGMDATVSPE